MESGDDGFLPPPEVSATAAEGLRLRALHGRGGTEVGLARAMGLAASRPVPPVEMRVIAAWFARFAYLHGKGAWDDPQRPSTGFIAWQLWGGDPGRAWVEGLRRDWGG
ncbi:DNA-binding protein [Paracoccus suum]|uniref:DNA-binding protein n=1 Tax=Paracoccus suum TaxID=2259340 RepID=A0A344PNT9_9RHOB|nr:DNA-binding protein [Paracoccus suum]